MKLTWLPGRHEAGIAISDDPDNGAIAGFKKIYDLLQRLHFPTSRAMWVFDPVEPTGTPSLPIRFFAPTLSDPECLEYCKELHQKDFEICLHGASSGNNTRERTIAAIEFMEREIGPLRTFICHSKNAENLYWDHKCVPLPFLSFLVGLYSKNSCFGEVKGSNYFWGDICRNKVSYIRLFRTRQINTLAFNPSMPYHDFHMPYVNYWFSATKGYLPRVCAPGRIDSLCKQRGAGIIYQYLHKYVDANGSIDPRVQESLERMAGDRRIFISPVSLLLDRLRQARMVFLLSYDGKTFLINASNQPYNSVQLLFERNETFQPMEQGIFEIDPQRAILKSIGALSVFQIQAKNALKTIPLKNVTMHSDIAEIRFPLGAIMANCSSHPITVTDRFPRLSRTYPRLRQLGPFEVKVFYFNDEAQRLEILTPLSTAERYRLFYGQFKILLREHLFLARKISVSEYVKNTGKVENQANW